MFAGRSARRSIRKVRHKQKQDGCSFISVIPRRFRSREISFRFSIKSLPPVSSPRIWK